jgi:hypothetical protein
MFIIGVICYINQNPKGWSVVYKNWREFLTFPQTSREVIIIYTKKYIDKCHKSTNYKNKVVKSKNNG